MEIAIFKWVTFLLRWRNSTWWLVLEAWYLDILRESFHIIEKVQHQHNLNFSALHFFTSLPELYIRFGRVLHDPRSSFFPLHHGSYFSHDIDLILDIVPSIYWIYCIFPWSRWIALTLGPLRPVDHQTQYYHKKQGQIYSSFKSCYILPKFQKWLKINQYPDQATAKRHQWRLMKLKHPHFSSN